MEEVFNQKTAEQIEADLLIEKGVIFTIKGFFGKKEIQFHIPPLVAETMEYCNEIAVRIKNNSEDARSLGNYLLTMNEKIKLKSEFIAAAYLHSGWKIKIFKKLVAWLLRKRLTSKQISEMVFAIITMYDIGNFTSSTILIGQTTLTSPKPKSPKMVDTKKED